MIDSVMKDYGILLVNCIICKMGCVCVVDEGHYISMWFDVEMVPDRLQFTLYMLYCMLCSDLYATN